MNGIMLDDGLDLIVKDGQLQIGDVVDAQIECVIRANRGEFKEAPLVGGEVYKLINGAPNANWAAQTKQQLNSVGLKIKSIKVSNNTITITR